MEWKISSLGIPQQVLEVSLIWDSRSDWSGKKIVTESILSFEAEMEISGNMHKIDYEQIYVSNVVVPLSLFWEKKVTGCRRFLEPDGWEKTATTVFFKAFSKTID